MSHDADDSRSLIVTTQPDGSAAWRLADEAHTLALGAGIGAALESGLVIYLEGNLGAGKTTLVRGLLRGLGHTGKVRSPTYTLVEIYSVRRLDLSLAVYHFDFYRLNQPEEYLEAGLEEYFRSDAVCLVEWPDKAAPHVPAADMSVALDFEVDGRRAVVRAATERGRQCLNNLISMDLRCPSGQP
jgi:tRNA threonylcarbamoyladenosine biosynthesis protein TsaE